MQEPLLRRMVHPVDSRLSIFTAFCVYMKMEMHFTIWPWSQEMNECVRNHSFLNDFFNLRCQPSLLQWEVMLWMKCPEGKLTLVEITFLNILCINSNFGFCIRPRGQQFLHVRTRLWVCNLQLRRSTITAKLQPFSAYRLSMFQWLWREMAHAVTHFGVTLNWLNIVIWGSIID